MDNTRLTFTASPKSYDFIANYENNPDLADDIYLFESTDNLISNELFDHTDETATDYSYSQKLSGTENSRVGSIIAIPVLKGDRLTAEVFAKYVEITNDPSETITSLGAALLGAFTEGFQVSNEFGSQTINSNFNQGSLIGTPGFDVENPSAPMAFLNMMFFTAILTDFNTQSSFSRASLSSQRKNGTPFTFLLF